MTATLHYPIYYRTANPDHPVPATELGYCSMSCVCVECLKVDMNRMGHSSMTTDMYLGYRARNFHWFDNPVMDPIVSDP